MEDLTNKKINGASNINLNMYKDYLIQNNTKNQNLSTSEKIKEKFNSGSNISFIRDSNIANTKTSKINSSKHHDVSDKLINIIQSTNYTNRNDLSVVNIVNSNIQKNNNNEISGIKNSLNINSPNKNNFSLNLRKINNHNTSYINSDNTDFVLKSLNSDKIFENNMLNLEQQSSNNCKKNISLISPIEKQEDILNIGIEENDNNYLSKYSEILNIKKQNNFNDFYNNIKINKQMNSSENETFPIKEYQGKIAFIFRDNSENVRELKKKIENQANIIDEYENWLILLLNILSQTKYQNHLRNVELVKYVI